MVQPGTPGDPGQMTPPQIMFQLIISGEEAGLILNKLNTASFTGFKEASMATTLFAKIQSASKVNPVVPQAVPRATVPSPAPVSKDSSTFTAPPNVEGDQEKPQEKIVDAVTEEDNRPTAPLTSLDDAREGKEVLAENETTTVPSAEDDSIFSVVERSTKRSGVHVGESDI